MPAIIKPLRVLWNEMIGFVFAVFAVVGASASYRGFSKEGGDGDDFLRAMVSGIFAAIMLIFCLQSFLRARRIKKS